MASLTNIKLIIGISDDSKDDLLNLYISRAESFVKQYCNIEELNEVQSAIVEDMTVYLYRNNGIENISSESKGSLSETYRDLIPDHLIKALNSHKRMRYI
ncbi:head-tail connector protein [Alteribacillus sp. YIM 98480]|uniref:head-tail connector protein n=1 Tax=Alteribacillus sp. YIM 98480 TaxID=2606599 RepID=UPI00131B33C3|nr:head-tail connector protein [Alteribacillus sp. YIM 98480]